MTPYSAHESSSAQTSSSTSMSFSSPSFNSGSSYRPISAVPIFLMPNMNMPFESFSDEEVDRVGWESFPPLVVSLEDEQEEEDISLAKCRRGSSSKDSMPKKSVSFSTVNIREHQVIVGDHPCTADSLPLSLGWAHAEESHVMDVDTYEKYRTSHRRCRSDMQLTFLERKNILKRVGGLSERDIMHEQRRAFRESFDDPAQRMRRVQTVAAMQTQAHPAQPTQQAPYLPPAVARAMSINPGCPINIEPRASVITA